MSKSAGFWWDDWFALVALVSLPEDQCLLVVIWRIWVVLIALQAVFIHWVAVGLGKHEDPATLSAVALTEFVVNLLYNTALTLVKLSALLFTIGYLGPSGHLALLCGRLHVYVLDGSSLSISWLSLRVFL